jgi:hypothetical protein
VPKKPPIRIAANDPTLAHAMSSAEIETLRRGSAILFTRLDRRMKVGAISKALRAHFGALLLDEQIDRAYGSRAKAQWFVLDAMSRYWFLNDALGDEFLYPNDLVVGKLVYDRNGLHWKRPPLQLSPHVVARFFQRTQRHSDIRGIALLKRHINTAWEKLVNNETMKPGDEKATTTAEGAMMWRAIPSRLNPYLLRAMTWISAETAVDPVLKTSMARDV